MFFSKKRSIYFLIVLLCFVLLNSCYKIFEDINYTYEPEYEGVSYLVDASSIYYDTCANPNSYGLMITEVSALWIEIYNTNLTQEVCLGDYQLRSIQEGQTTVKTYSLPKLSIEPQSYFIIRFRGNVANNSKDMAILNGPGLSTISGLRTGVIELTLNSQTVDYVGFCSSGSGGRLANPTTGSFSGCISYPSSYSLYGSFSLDVNHSDNNSGSDWTFRNIVTFGGRNDVTDETDSDQDGIPDANEQSGTTFAGMPVYDWGARANQKDLFVFVTYMDGGDYRDESGYLIKEGLVPFRESFEKIRSVFNAHGYKIHFDLGTVYSTSINPTLFNLSGISHEVPYSTYTDLNENAVSSLATPNAASVILYKNRYMPINRFGIFHHGLLASQASWYGSRADHIGGIAELPGNDFVLYLGGGYIYAFMSSTAKQNYLATIFMHELGHNLNLRHGGYEDNNNKPNYFSIMNYGYIYRGVPLTNNGSVYNFYNRYLWMSGRTTSSTIIFNSFTSSSFTMNFSTGVMPDLDENNLTEINPLGTRMGNVDWNVDGKYTNRLSYNINPSYSATGDGLKVHKDYDDWSNIQLPFDQTISRNGYGNLRPLSYLMSDTSPPSGVELIGTEGGSPIILDPHPEYFHEYDEEELHR